eukprot:TRINITY_DN3979_c0_g1_i1.p1 TRINITY_DN3979_c0_g1~~TRINITY_DN3979_c0_g1_i1.p1  ORF type:complete len:100 (-),score=30.84 TRINITY_DN3979_c0_g1_i1:99-398(-)
MKAGIEKELKKLSAVRPLTEKDEAQLMRWFLAADTDGSGLLSREEIKEFLTKMPHLKWTEDKLEECIAVMDTDWSGKITFSEFKRGIQSLDVLGKIKMV